MDTWATLHYSNTKLDYLHSKPFTLVIKDDKDPQPGAARVFYVHKELLTSLSVEFRNHVENNMREGRLGIMEVSGVDEPTMKSFLEWAYRGDYTT